MVNGNASVSLPLCLICLVFNLGEKILLFAVSQILLARLLHFFSWDCRLIKCYNFSAHLARAAVWGSDSTAFECIEHGRALVLKLFAFALVVSRVN